MHNFSQIAIKLLNDYRNLLKKQLSAEESTVRLASLGLDRRLSSHEVNLYHLVMRVIQAASEDRPTSPQACLKYSGVEQFLQHMKNVIAFYRLQDGRVIHTTQTASRAMINAIQWLSLGDGKRTLQLATQLDEAASVIARYGLEEQKAVFLSSLRACLPQDVDFYLPLLNNYQRYLMETLYPDGEEIDVDPEEVAEVAC